MKPSLWKMRVQSWGNRIGLPIGNHLFKIYGRKFKVRPVSIRECFSPSLVRSLGAEGRLNLTLVRDLPDEHAGGARESWRIPD